MRVSNWWHNFHFCVNYSFKLRLLFWVIYYFKKTLLLFLQSLYVFSVIPAYYGRFLHGQTGSLPGFLYPAHSSGWSVPTDEWPHQRWWCWPLPVLRFEHGSRLHHLHSPSLSPLSEPMRKHTGYSSGWYSAKHKKNNYTKIFIILYKYQ